MVQPVLTITTFTPAVAALRQTVGSSVGFQMAFDRTAIRDQPMPAEFSDNDAADVQQGAALVSATPDLQSTKDAGPSVDPVNDAIRSDITVMASEVAQLDRAQDVTMPFGVSVVSDMPYPTDQPDASPVRDVANKAPLTGATGQVPNFAVQMPPSAPDGGFKQSSPLNDVVPLPASMPQPTSVLELATRSAPARTATAQLGPQDGLAGQNFALPSESRAGAVLIAAKTLVEAVTPQRADDGQVDAADRRSVTLPGVGTVPSVGSVGTAVTPEILPQNGRLADATRNAMILTELSNVGSQIPAEAENALMPVGDRYANPPVMTTAAGVADTPRHLAQQMVVAIANQSGNVTEIALSPSELGRVRMQITAQDGILTLQIVAERPDTIDLLRRHIDILAQEFRALGFQDLSFSFGEEGAAKPKSDQSGPPTGSHTDSATDVEVGATTHRPTTGALDLRL